MKYRFELISGGGLIPAPGLVLSRGALRFRLLNSEGRPVPSEAVQFHVTFGGGQLRAQDPSVTFASLIATSFVEATTDSNGEVDAPAFALGPEAGINGLMVVSANASYEHVIESRTDNIGFEILAPLPAHREILADDPTDIHLRVVDTANGNAPLPFHPVEIEVTDGASVFRVNDEALGHYDLRRAGEDGEIRLTLLPARREERVVLRFQSYLHREVSPAILLLDIKTPRLLSWSGGSVRPVGTGMLGYHLRPETSDSSDAILSPDDTFVYGLLVHAEESTGKVSVEPPLTGGVREVANFFPTPELPGDFRVEMRLPDYPDSAPYSVRGTSSDPYSGSVPATTSPGPLSSGFRTYVTSQFGGNSDPAHYLQVSPAGGAVQYLGPNATSQPIAFTVEVLPRANPNVLPRLVEAEFRLKTRLTPFNSGIDDPAAGATRVAGTLSRTSAGPRADEITITVAGNVGQHALEAFFHANEYDYDHVIEVTAEATMEDEDASGAPIQYTEKTSLLVRAAILRPRLYFSALDGGDYKPILEAGIRPVTLFAPDGTELTPSPEDAFYVEMRSHDVGAEIRCYVQNRTREVVLRRVGAEPTHVLYRSDPCYLYADDLRYGGPTTPAATGAEFFPATRAPELRAWIADQMPGNTLSPDPLVFFTANRPVSTFDLVRAGDLQSETLPPPPRISPSIPASLALTGRVDGGRLLVQLTGRVWDCLADIGLTAPTTIEVNGQSYPLSAGSERSSFGAPSAWVGAFDVEIPVRLGVQHAVIEVENALGQRATRRVELDVRAADNAFLNPTHIDVTARPVPHVSDAALPLVSYLSMTGTDADPRPVLVDATVEALEPFPGAGVTQILPRPMRKVAGTALAYRSEPFVTVQASKLPTGLVPPARVLAFVDHARIGWRSDQLPNAAGPMSIATARRCDCIEFFAEKRDAAGNWARADDLSTGDTLRFVAETRADYPDPVIGTMVSVTDAAQVRAPGDGHDAYIEFERVAPGRFELARYLGPNWSTIQVDRAELIPEHAPAPPSDVLPLRIPASGGITLGELTTYDRPLLSLPAFNAPARIALSTGPMDEEGTTEGGGRLGYRASVVPGTLEMVHSWVELELGVHGVQTAFGRTHCSGSTYDGPLGPGWNAAWNSWLWRPADDEIRVLRGDAQVIRFTRDAQGVWQPQRGVYASLEVGPDGIRLLFPKGRVETYLPVSSHFGTFHALTAEHDAFQNATFMRHGAAGRALAETNAFRLTRQILWTTKASRVQSTGDHAGNSYVYGYYGASDPDGHEGNLKTVRSPIISFAENPFPNGRTDSYGYDPAGPRHQIKWIQDPEGNAGGAPPVATFEYHSDGRLERQTLPSGSVVFNTARTAGGSSGFTLTWTDGRGNDHMIDFDDDPGSGLAPLPASVTTAVNGVDLTETLIFNDQRELASHTRPMGNATHWDYDASNADPRARANLSALRQTPDTTRRPRVHRTLGITNFHSPPVSGDITEIRIAYDHSPDYQEEVLHRDPLTQETISVYSGPFLSEITYPQVTFRPPGQPAEPRKQSFLWSNYGQLLRSVDENGVVTRFYYYPIDDPFGLGTGTPHSTQTQPGGRLAQRIVDVVDPAIPRRAGLAAPRPVTTEFRYDRWGRIVETVDGTRSTKTQYNEVGEPVRTDGPEGEISRLHYDANGRVISRFQHISDLGLPADLGTSVTASVVRDALTYTREEQLETLTVDADGLALKTEYEYDANGNLIWERSPRNFDAADPIASAVNKYEYDEDDRLITETRAHGMPEAIQISYTYTLNGELDQEIHDGNRVKTHLYDGFARMIGAEDQLGTRRMTLVDDAGNLTREFVEGSIDGTPGNRGVLAERHIYYDEAHRVIGEKELGFRWEPDGAGGFTRVDDTGGGRITRRFHDPVGNPIRIDLPGGVRQSFTYDGHRNVATEADTAGTSRVYQYDPHHQPTLVTTTDAMGTMTEGTSYDKSGRISTRSFNGRVVSRAWYDTGSRSRLTEDAVGNRTETIFDAASRPTKTRNVLFDLGQRVNRDGSTNSVNNTFESELVYDANGNVTRIIDALGIATDSMTYNANDAVATHTLPDDAFPGTSPPRDDNPGAEVYIYSYTAGGLVDTVTDPNGNTITHAYDLGGNLSSVSVAGSGLVGSTGRTFVHDGAGSIIVAEDNNGASSGFGSRVTRRYTSYGTIWFERQECDLGPQATSNDILAGHHVEGGRARLTYPGGAPNLHTPHTAYGHANIVRDNTTSLEYADFVYTGPYLSFAAFDNGIKWGFGYDSDHEIVQIRTFTGNDFSDDSSMIEGRHYHLDRLGLVEMDEDLKEDTFSRLAYDSLYRLESQVDGYDATDPLDEPESGMWWTYDARGNPRFAQGGPVRDRTSSGRLMIRVDYDAANVVNEANQLGQRTLTDLSYSAGFRDRVEQFYYDRNGNLIRDGYQSYEYDFSNRLVRVVPHTAFPDDTAPAQPGPPQSYAYDAFGRRIRADDRTLLYFEDELIRETVDGGSWTRNYIWAPGRGLVSFETDESGSPQRYFTHLNRAGSVSFLSDSAGAIAERYSTDLFGTPKVLDEDGDPQDAADRTGMPLLMQGHYYEPDTRLHFVGPRVLHPFTNRFMQRDPTGTLGDPMARKNPYVGSGNNSANLRDNGRWAQLFAIGFYLLVGILIALVETGVEYTIRRALGVKRPFHFWDSFTRNLLVGYATNWIPGAIGARYAGRTGIIIAGHAAHILLASGIEYAAQSIRNLDPDIRWILGGNIVGSALFGVLRIPGNLLRRRVGNWIMMKRFGLHRDTPLTRIQGNDGVSLRFGHNAVDVTPNPLSTARNLPNWDTTFGDMLLEYLIRGFANLKRGQRWHDGVADPGINTFPAPVWAQRLPQDGLNVSTPGAVLYEMPVGKFAFEFRLGDVLDRNGRIFHDRGATKAGVHLFVTFDGRLPGHVIGKG